MHVVINPIQNALAYAKFPNPEMRVALTDYLTVLGQDLNETDYEQGTSVDEELENLNEKMAEINSSHEETIAAIDDAEVTDETSTEE